jgi:hypothetical protein
VNDSSRLFSSLFRLWIGGRISCLAPSLGVGDLRSYSIRIGSYGLGIVLGTVWKCTVLLLVVMRPLGYRRCIGWILDLGMLS